MKNELNDSDEQGLWLRKLLPAALRRAEDEPEPSFPPPTPEERDAYLHGGLHPSRRREIQEILIRSEEQRRAMVKRGKSIEDQAKQNASKLSLESIRRWFQERLLVPVAAGIAVLVVGTLWLSKSDNPTDSLARILVSDSGSPVINIVSERDGAGGPVQLPEGKVAVKVPVIVPATGPAPTRVEIRRSSGAVVWKQTLSASDIVKGWLTIEINVGLLAPADYSIVVVNENGVSIPTGEFRR